MTTEELEKRIRADNLRVTIFGAIDAFTLCRTLEWSRSTLTNRIQEGNHPPYKKITGKLWFYTAPLAKWMTDNDY